MSKLISNKKERKKSSSNDTLNENSFTSLQKRVLSFNNSETNLISNKKNQQQQQAATFLKNHQLQQQQQPPTIQQQQHNNQNFKNSTENSIANNSQTKLNLTESTSTTTTTTTPPPKPMRIPTIKSKQKPDKFLNFLKQQKQQQNKSDNDDDDDDYDNEYERIKEERQRKLRLRSDGELPPPPPIPMDENNNILKTTTHDINPPNFNNFISIYSYLNEYKCDIIVDKTKRLDRNAIIELNNLLLNNNDRQELANNLAKCITFEDLQLLRYNIDFGLGIYDGLELLSLPHGDIIRLDLIDRCKTFKLFIPLSVLLLTQQSIDQRCSLLILWIDCALYLFEKYKNLYAFSYIIQALNHPQLKRLNETWSYLRQTNEIKYNLFEMLNKHYDSLSNGDYFSIEKEALIPNIYPIALLLCDLNENNETQELVDDVNTFKWSIETYLSENLRYYAKNSNEYAKRSELFMQQHYAPLFSFKLVKKQTTKDDKDTENKKNLLKLSQITQTEFQQILMWSNDFKNYIQSHGVSNRISKHSLSALIPIATLLNQLCLRINDINTILVILSSKIQIQ